MDNNETQPLQDWRASQQGNRQGYNQQANGQQGYNQYPQSNQTQFMPSKFDQPQYGQQQYGQTQYGQHNPVSGVPAEVENMKIVKLVFAFILFFPLAIPALIFFIKAKCTVSSDPNQAIYFSERFNRFSNLAIRIGIIIYAISFTLGIIEGLTK